MITKKFSSKTELFWSVLLVPEFYAIEIFLDFMQQKKSWKRGDRAVGTIHERKLKTKIVKEENSKRNEEKKTLENFFI